VQYEVYSYIKFLMKRTYEYLQYLLKDVRYDMAHGFKFFKLEWLYYYFLNPELNLRFPSFSIQSPNF
jgi:hypothetical protein